MQNKDKSNGIEDTTKNLDFSRGFLLEVLITSDKRYR